MNFSLCGTPAAARSLSSSRQSFVRKSMKLHKDGERVDIEDLFDGLSRRLEELSEEQRSET